MTRLIIFSCFLFLVSGKLIAPRGIFEETEEQLEQLRQIVQGEILSAFSEIETIESDFQTTADLTVVEGTIALQQEQDTINVQLSTIKDLANAAHKDISNCLLVREDALNALPDTYNSLMKNCTIENVSNLKEFSEPAKYNVDVTINTVHLLEAQLNICGNDLLCLSPLITEIELNKIRIPQRIKTEVLVVQDMETQLKVSLQNCDDSNVARYTIQANGIMGDILACVDAIIG